MLVPATSTDRDPVLAWRNHPDVRAVSLSRHEITPAEHADWWTRALADPTKRILIYRRRDIPSGVVNFFDITSETASWGYFLDGPGLTEHGQLLMAWIEIQRLAVKYAFQDLQIACLQGEVLATNTAVRQLNRRQGFVETISEKREIDGELVEVLRIELTAETALKKAAKATKGTS